MKLFLPLVFAVPSFAAEPPRALPPAEPPKDARLGALKDLDGYFPFTPSSSPEAWAVRAEQVRMQLRVALGLWPEPTRTPLNAVIHGRIEQPDYTVEKVSFESMPGFFVTGSLFRPRTPGPHPAVLCPHGHWPDGRFQRRDDKEMAKEIASGGERFPECGRSIFQSLGVQLARMGCVAFVVDMLGYADSQQISYELAHKFAKQRPGMSTRENWGLFSPQAEAHAQSILGLQTWNNIRALDFLTSLPDVDAKRLGCTGASGGGTQTMLLGGLDPRLAVSVPAVMVSTAMQGGCTCENASQLRIGTGNVEFAALFAPKPLAMTAANDWTKEMPTKGFPDLQRHWAMLGAPDNVALWAMPQFGHNYNVVSREKIYAWFNRHFALGLSDEQLREREFPLLTREQLTVWDDAHPAPPGGDDFERKLLRWWHDDAQAQLAKSPEDFTKIARPAWATLIGRSSASGSLPPNGRDGKGPGVIWLSTEGETGLLGADGEPLPDVRRLIGAGCRVIDAPLFQGDLAGSTNPVVKNPREAPAYTYGYNSPLFARRVQALLRLLETERANFTELVLVALDSTAPIAAAALALAEPGTVQAAVLDTHGFRFGALTDWRDVAFLPGAAKFGDVPGLIRLAAPVPLYLRGEPDLAPSANVTLAPREVPPSAAIDWLVAHVRKTPSPASPR